MEFAGIITEYDPFHNAMPHRSLRPSRRARAVWLSA